MIERPKPKRAHQLELNQCLRRRVGTDCRCLTCRFIVCFLHLSQCIYVLSYILEVRYSLTCLHLLHVSNANTFTPKYSILITATNQLSSFLGLIK